MKKQENNAKNKILWANLIKPKQIDNDKIKENVKEWPKLLPTDDQRDNVQQQRQQQPNSEQAHEQNFEKYGKRNSNNDDTQLTINFNNLTLNSKASSSNTNYEKLNDNRSRDDVIKERKDRKQQKKHEKQMEKYENQLINLRQPKTDKLKIIDNKTYELYLKNKSNNLQITNNGIKFKKNVSSQHAQGLLAEECLSAEKITKKQKIKQLKKRNLIEINLSDLLFKNVNKNSSLKKDTLSMDTSTISKMILQKKKLPTQLNRGKKREIPKKKYISLLKRNILNNRKARQNQREEDLERIQSQENYIEPYFRSEHNFSSSIIFNFTEINFKTNEIYPLKHENQLNSKNTVVKHSRKFRSYCNNFITTELCECTELLLKDIFRFQLRAYNKNEIKARAHKRYVVGFKETKRQLEAGKLRLLIIAPDLEKCDGPGGIDDLINDLKMKCDEFNVPYIFSVNRRKIGYLLLKKVPVSCVGVISYDGCEDTIKILLNLIDEERNRYLECI